jgi:asparagine synthase (glutamine-hydrolysing)
MSLLGLFLLNGSDYSSPSIARGNTVFKFRSGYLQIDHEWLNQLDPKSFLILSRKHEEKKVENLSEFIAPRNAQYFSCNLNSDFFYSYSSNIKTPISFSIFYDETKEIIHIARDAFGTIPIFYIHIPNQVIAFSTNIESLKEISVLKSYFSLNVSQISSYLRLSHCEHPYDEQTHYDQVKNVLPGQIIEFSRTEIKAKIYLKYNTTAYGDLRNSEDFAYSFRLLFENSVARALHRPTNVGCQLSGGLDSSSVSSLVRQLLPHQDIHTFYLDSLTDLGDESDYANQVAASISSIHHTIPQPNSTIDDLILCTELFAQPIFATGPSITLSMFEKVRATGCTTILTGHDGDSVVGDGRSYVSDLIREKKWNLLKSELKDYISLDKFTNEFGVASKSLPSQAKLQLLFKKYIEIELVKFLKSRSFLDAFKILKIGFVEFGINPYFLLASLLKKLNSKYRRQINDFPIDIRTKSLSNYLSLSSDYNNLNSKFSDSQQFFYYSDLSYKQNIRANEEQFYLGRHFGINVYHPFFDPKLYEFCQSVPSHITFDNGRGRGALRHAMKDILVETVRNRTTKGDYSDYAKNETLRLYKISQDFLTITADVWNYVDHRKFLHCVSNLSNPKYSVMPLGMTMFFIERTIFLAVWLENLKKVR